MVIYMSNTSTEVSIRWNELSNADRESFNNAINAVASGGTVTRDGETFTVKGYRETEETTPPSAYQAQLESTLRTIALYEQRLAATDPADPVLPGIKARIVEFQRLAVWLDDELARRPA